MWGRIGRIKTEDSDLSLLGFFMSKYLPLKYLFWGHMIRICD
ncbi:hypothetical protein ALFP_2295 [Alcaligenes faecalis]|nr:hypothetical protein ALFP_2295 [Alcaligenes faecalis]